MEANGKLVRIGALELRFLLDETQGSGDLVMFEFIVPADARVPVPHYHRDVDEVIYGLEGTMTTTINGERHALKPGESRFIRRGSVHVHENLAPATARALIIMNPGTIGRRYFEEMAALVNAPVKPDVAKMEEIMLRYGLVPA